MKILSSGFTAAALLMGTLLAIAQHPVEYVPVPPDDITTIEAANQEMEEISRKAKFFIYGNKAWTPIPGPFEIDGERISMKGDKIYVFKGSDYLDAPVQVYRWNSPTAYIFSILIGDTLASLDFRPRDLPSLKRFADLLYFIQHQYQVQQDEDQARFEKQASEYRSLQVKPPVSEEQRRLIVQANAANNRKHYAEALELYHKSVDLDPVAFPAAYYNMALLCAQINRPAKAIANMKKYLLLLPEAPDARAAQDKIYEWEYQLK